MPKSTSVVYQIIEADVEVGEDLGDEQSSENEFPSIDHPAKELDDDSLSGGNVGRHLYINMTLGSVKSTTHRSI